MTSLRFKMVENAIFKKAKEPLAPTERITEYYAKNVFDDKKMKNHLSPQDYVLVQQAIEQGKPLNSEIAEIVAAAMLNWAKEMGATHYTHWFQPLTGGTAEKHDAFFEFNKDGEAIERFSGKLLMQQEPDASSFPNGGIRNTFEARGYSAWDPSSPAFVVDTTLCIPTIFISYTGESLDYKTPLLRTIEAVDSAATTICKYFDDKVNNVVSFLGWEQEYFLLDENLWAGRPDLMITGRTLLGHESAKNQQLEDHYFGAIPTRVIAFMKDLEFECWKLGIPVKTRHNEAAPNQFELAPIYETMNLANDHNQLLMSVMKRVARRHCFRILLHEKPFKGVNGSGKHCNWSLGTNTGVNLIGPAKTDIGNLQFFAFLVNIMKAVHKHNAVIKASIASATNLHRLGAAEAPPSIISIFMGTQISAILNGIETGEVTQKITFNDKNCVAIEGISHMPQLFLDNTDRNRTSPFAFTGNRFEFRAVGSSSNCAGSMIVILSALAEQLIDFDKDIKANMAGGIDSTTAIYSTIQKYITECKDIIFDGNGYSEEWKEEAGKRGIDRESSVPLIIDNYLSDSSVELFTKLGVMSKSELESRAEVSWETFTKKIQIESRVLADMAINHILPVASRYQNTLLDKLYKLKTLFAEDKYLSLASVDLEAVEVISNHIFEIQRLTNEMVDGRIFANACLDERSKAIAYNDRVFPFLDRIRFHIDSLELIIDNEIWPLPKYRELLFIR